VSVLKSLAKIVSHMYFLVQAGDVLLSKVPVNTKFSSVLFEGIGNTFLFNGLDRRIYHTIKSTFKLQYRFCQSATFLCFTFSIFI
jgi:hypothetical protein